VTAPLPADVFRWDHHTIERIDDALLAAAAATPPDLGPVA